MAIVVLAVVVVFGGIDISFTRTLSVQEYPELPQTEPVNRMALSAEEFERILMGEWSSVYREEDMIYTGYYDFFVERDPYWKWTIR